MKLNITFEVKGSGERYVAENNFGSFKFVALLWFVANSALLSPFVVQPGKVHQICICQKGHLKREYRLCASMNSPEF